MMNPMNFDKEEYNKWIEAHKEWIGVFIDDKVLKHFNDEQEQIDEENYHGHLLYYLLNTAFLLKTNPILKYPLKEEALLLPMRLTFLALMLQMKQRKITSKL